MFPVLDFGELPQRTTRTSFHIAYRFMATSTSRKSRAATVADPTPALRRSGTRRHTAADVLADFDLLKDSLGYTLKLAQVRTYEMLYASLGPNAISPARMTALSMIATQPGISQSALADRLRIARPSVVKVVDTLESLGLIERQPGADRRSYALALTPRGHKELHGMRARVRSYEEAITSHLTPAERGQLMKLLAKVAIP